MPPRSMWLYCSEKFTWSIYTTLVISFMLSNEIDWCTTPAVWVPVSDSFLGALLDLQHFFVYWDGRYNQIVYVGSSIATSRC